MYINQKDALSQEKTTLSRASLDVSPPENTTPSRKNAISPTTTLKVGLYTPQTEWLEAKLNEIPNLLTERIDEPTGLYLSLEHSTETSASRFQPLWDFDDADNPERGLADARRFVQLLCESGIPLHALMPFASGRKGIHIAAKHLLQPRTDWYSVFAHAAEHLWAEEFPTLDGGIYKNRALIRAGMAPPKEAA
jgi:hypothetical protein